VLALDSNGRPVVAWQENPGVPDIYVRAWDGSAWSELDGSGSGGGVSNTPGFSSYPSLVVDHDDRPAVAWQESTGEYEIYVRRWNGSTWAEAGSGAASNGGVSDDPESSQRPSLGVMGNGDLVVAWEHDAYGLPRIFLRRLTPSGWAEYWDSASGAGLSNSSAWSDSPRVATRGDRVCVAYAGLGLGSSEIVLRCADWP
jgi:hypothetical protein